MPMAEAHHSWTSPASSAHPSSLGQLVALLLNLLVGPDLLALLAQVGDALLDLLELRLGDLLLGLLLLDLVAEGVELVLLGERARLGLLLLGLLASLLGGVH